MERRTIKINTCLPVSRSPRAFRATQVSRRTIWSETYSSASVMYRPEVKRLTVSSGTGRRLRFSISEKLRSGRIRLTTAMPARNRTNTALTRKSLDFFMANLLKTGNTETDYRSPPPHRRCRPAGPETAPPP